MSSTLRLGLAAAVVVAATVGGSVLPELERTGPSVAAPTRRRRALRQRAPSSAGHPAELDDVHIPAVRLHRQPSNRDPVTPATEEWPLGAIVGNEEPWVDKFFAPSARPHSSSQLLPEGARRGGRAGLPTTAGGRAALRGAARRVGRCHRRRRRPGAPSSRAAICRRSSTLGRGRPRLGDQRQPRCRRPDASVDRVSNHWTAWLRLPTRQSAGNPPHQTQPASADRPPRPETLASMGSTRLPAAAPPTIRLEGRSQSSRARVIWFRCRSGRGNVRCATSSW